ncbi:Protein N-acetyltransferase, RimJ/RimL family [Geodermatophilus saharensis]|uniref:Protein N-acetyltransferase, RimJ/RimL family n=1 Tax=Geodermatophilus saharensis TaxID=1137994 RepID=A0A238ZU58_9ACTN|nr:GNAT family N-acetyltransferase [Geodermatophilus saharensis]SNR86551.1 Protein N-acetyltransferase, RimJ/RimL family [Geodermatophilus saharensis]
MLRVEVLALSGPAFSALADGDLAAADAASPVPLPPVFADPDWAPVWRLRAAQAAADPAVAEWVTGVVWDPDRRLAVGRAGFHGPPDERGTVEIGYAVLPEHRRRGYARAALAAMLDRARADPAVRVVRLSIAPDNVASLAVARPFGFVEVGQEVDPDDGLEIVYELPV